MCIRDSIIFKTILDPGNEVMVFAPYFGEYKSYAANFDAKIVEVMPDEADFMPDLADFERKITKDTRAVIINNQMCIRDRFKGDKKMRDGFIKVAAVTPKVVVADPVENTIRIKAAVMEAATNGAKVIVCPELCITGYTCGDLFLQMCIRDR